MNTKEEAPTTEEIEEVASEAIIEEVEAPILLGIQQRATLETSPYDTWFRDNYKQHTLDTVTIQTIKSDLASSDITVFMGTWCEDSQREAPAFYKILDLAGIDSNTIKLITVSEDKDTPEGLEDGLDITNVPTIIFSKDGKELGRIVEYPLESLEKDMAKILSGQEYKHAYAE
jgi:thiol-disulfide isomerase/thioredoxin